MTHEHSLVYPRPRRHSDLQLAHGQAHRDEKLLQRLARFAAAAVAFRARALLLALVHGHGEAARVVDEALRTIANLAHVVAYEGLAVVPRSFTQRSEGLAMKHLEFVDSARSPVRYIVRRLPQRSRLGV